MKKLIKIICIVFIYLGFYSSISAEGNATESENVLLISSNPNKASSYYQDSVGMIVDTANLLNSSEEQNLLTTFQGYADEYQYDIALITVNSLNGKDSGDAAYNYIDRFELGYHNENGALLLLISITEREWYIAGYGPITSSITNRRIDIIGDEIVPYLRDGNYYEAGLIYAQTVKEIYNGTYEFSGMDSIPIINEVENPAVFLFSLVCAVVVVAAISAILPNHFKAELQNIAPRQGARDYIVRGSFRVLHRRDNFITKTVSKTKRSSDSSSSGGGSRSSGGGSRSGGGGRF